MGSCLNRQARRNRKTQNQMKMAHGGVDLIGFEQECER